MLCGGTGPEKEADDTIREICSQASFKRPNCLSLRRSVSFFVYTIY
jgi:hypothetical protein